MHPSWLAPFSVKAFRLQWPAALVTVWALEMETLILGWYVLVETGSVVLLTLFGASLYLGTLVAPFTGIHGWYLRNDGEEAIVVRLKVAGFYELLSQ